MLFGVGAVIAVVALAGAAAAAASSAKSATKLAFGALTVGAGAVIAFAFGRPGDPSVIGIALVVAGLAIGAVAVWQDATSG